LVARAHPGTLPLDASARRTSVTVDVEGDFGTSSLRGVDEALPWLLDRFDELGVRAVLFTTGLVARARPQAVRAALARGHVAGSHTMSHARLSRTPRALWRAELLDSRIAVEDVAGVPCRAFRAPFFDLPDGIGPLLVETGYAWSSSKAPLSLVRGLRHYPATRGPHRLDASAVVEHPVGGWLGLPVPEGLSYRRVLWPLTALPTRPPRVFYLHPYDVLPDIPACAWTGLTRRIMTVRQGEWSRAHLVAWLRQWKAQGAAFEPPEGTV